MIEFVKALAVPRFPGTKGEHQVQDYLVNFFREHGFDVEERPFTVSKFPLVVLPRLGLGILCLLVIAAYYVLPLSRLTSLGITVLTLVLFCATSRWTRVLERFYNLKMFGQFNSKNIIATKPASHSHSHLVYVAHYDSKSQAFPSYARFFLFLIVLITASLSLLGIAASAMFAVQSHGLIYPIVLLCIGSLVLQFNRTHNQSPGAFDNASGVAVLLELARQLSHKELSGCDASFIATGAEEVGLGGAIKLLQDENFRTRFDPQRTFIVNFDGTGARGKILITDRHGTLPFKAGGKLSSLVADICRQLGFDHRRSWLPTGMLMDHIPFSRHGYQSITISSAGWRKAMLSMHSKNDVVENICEKSLENCLKIGYEIRQRLSR